MNSLLIDTSNKAISIAVNKDRVNLAELNANVAKTHSETLMKYISHLLGYADMKKTDIDRIIVARGPGSYTGIRIGVTVAKTLAYSLKVDLYSVSSLFALAASADRDGVTVPLFDARRGSVFAAAYKFTGNEYEEVLAPSYFKYSDLKDELVDEDANYYGNTTEKFKDVDGFHHLTPRIANAERYESALKKEDVHGMVPEYLRVSEAERNWMEKNQ